MGEKELISDYEDLSHQFINNLQSLDEHIPAKSIARMLKLDQVEIGFVLTRNQFDSITTLVMEKQAKVCPGMWSNFFYPLSGHVVFKLDFLDMIVYPLLALSTNFPYYKWIYGPGLPGDWVKFADMIKGTDCDYVLFKDEKSREMLCAINSVSGKFYQSNIHVGGGRMYCHSVARPYEIGQYDKVIKPIPTNHHNLHEL